MPAPISIVITANSPGEVSGWVKPAVAAIKAMPWPTSISVFIPPCTFASGSECSVVRAMPEVDLVAGPAEFLRYTALGVPPRGFSPSRHGVVIFLGGDLTYAVILAKKLHYPAIAYTEGFVNWSESFARFAVPYPQIGRQVAAKGVAGEKVRVIGNLMLDATRPAVGPERVRAALGAEGRPLLLIMPGSRPAEVEYMTPFFLQVVELMAKEIPDLATALSISPFVDDAQLSQVLASPNARLFGLPGTFTPGEVADDGGTEWESPGLVQGIEGPAIPAFRGRQYDLMSAADLALTIPGTNTVELSFLGVPMVVALPLNYPERIPLEGLAGLIGNLPKLGKELKRRILPRLLAKIRHAAWPNRLADEFIVPEIRGKIAPDDVARVATGLLQNHSLRAEMAEKLRSVIGEGGAATRLAELVGEVLDERFGEAWRK